MGAYELYSVSAVNITSFEYQGAINTAVPDRDDISEGDFASVVIGIVVAFLMLIVVVYLCMSGGANKSSIAITIQKNKNRTPLLLIWRPLGCRFPTAHQATILLYCREILLCC